MKLALRLAGASSGYFAVSKLHWIVIDRCGGIDHLNSKRRPASCREFQSLSPVDVNEL